MRGERGGNCGFGTWEFGGGTVCSQTVLLDTRTEHSPAGAVPPAGSSLTRVGSAKGREILTNKAILKAGKSAASVAAGATCGAAGGRRLQKTKPFRGRPEGRVRSAWGGTVPTGPCCSKRGPNTAPRGLWHPQVRARQTAWSLQGIDTHGLTHFGSAAKRSVSLRNFPKLSVSFRFVPLRSAPFRFVPPGSDWLRPVAKLKGERRGKWNRE